MLMMVFIWLSLQTAIKCTRNKLRYPSIEIQIMSSHNLSVKEDQWFFHIIANHIRV